MTINAEWLVKAHADEQTRHDDKYQRRAVTATACRLRASQTLVEWVTFHWTPGQLQGGNGLRPASLYRRQW